jgi:hypothetical protein
MINENGEKVQQILTAKRKNYEMVLYVMQMRISQMQQGKNEK